MEKFLDGKEFTFQRIYEEKPCPARLVGFSANGKVVIEFDYNVLAKMPLPHPQWSMVALEPNDKRIKVVKKKHVTYINGYQYPNGNTALIAYDNEKDAIHYAELRSRDELAGMTIVKARRIEVEED